jgi:hypothetical protein
MHTGQVPPQANSAGQSRPANKPRKLTTHEQRVGDFVAVCSLDNTSEQQQHHHCHFHHRARCFTSIELPAHYSVVMATVQALIRCGSHHRARCFTSIELPAHCSCGSGCRSRMNPLKRSILYRLLHPDSPNILCKQIQSAVTIQRPLH